MRDIIRAVAFFAAALRPTFGTWMRGLPHASGRRVLLVLPADASLPTAAFSSAAASALPPAAAPARPCRLLVLASGGGSNAQRLIEHFAVRPAVAQVVGLLTNNPRAGALAHATRAGIPTLIFERAAWRDGTVQALLARDFAPDLLVLAGFLWLVPPPLVTAYAGRILNIHPSLLPRFGGKGMHGHHVHEAVLAAGEPESGMTVHLVNEHYDEGAPLFQARCLVLPTDTSATLAARVLTLEHRYFPLVVEAFISGARTPAEVAGFVQATTEAEPA